MTTDYTSTETAEKQCTYKLDPDEQECSSLSETWQCPHDCHVNSDYCLFHMPTAKRADREISDSDVADAFRHTLQNGNSRDRKFIGTTLPELRLDYMDIESEHQHPIDLRHSTIDAVSAVHSRFEERLDVRHCRIGTFDVSDAEFENGIFASEATFSGDLRFFETAVSGGDAAFDGATFEGDAVFNEAVFGDDLSFADAVFQGLASFEGSELHGRSHAIGDNTNFSGATFEQKAKFTHATLKATSFAGVSFCGDTVFTEVTADGGVIFDNAQFDQKAEFNEATFDEDTSFRNVVFCAAAMFRGVEFLGGAALLDDDIAFEGTEFRGSVDFEYGQFGYANFSDVSFGGMVNFERSTFSEDVTFVHASFNGIADFDEIRVYGDCDFSEVVFGEDAIFRGAEFHGGTNHHEDDAIFAQSVFNGEANFHDVQFTSVNFLDTQFEGSGDFTDTEITERLRLQASSYGDDTYLNFTDATIADGEITQPEDGWIRADLTKATLGSVQLSTVDKNDERKVLDYFRFCDTTFDGFNFSDHMSYLDRNDWTLHDFDAGTQEYEFAVEMSPEMIERTYVKAKTDASDQSNIKAAGEFRVKRQQYARKKFYAIAADRSESLFTRVRNGLRGLENLFLGVSCGYGLRLYRITAVFLLFPLLSAALFALGGTAFETEVGQVAITELFSAEGLETLSLNIYFSYITFLTIGYGNIGPIGFGARGMAALLVYVNVILSGLFLYSLIKRSEI